MKNHTEEMQKEVQIPFDLQLLSPIKVGEDTVIEVLTFNREPQAGDFEDMDPSKMKLGDMLHILSKITAQPRKTVINKMGSRDMFKAIEVLNNFLPDSQKDGDDI